MDLGVWPCVVCWALRALCTSLSHRLESSHQTFPVLAVPRALSGVSLSLTTCLPLFFLCSLCSQVACLSPPVCPSP